MMLKYCVTLGLVYRVARLALLGPNFRNFFPNNTYWPQNFRLALWLFFQGRLGPLQELL